MPYKSGIEFEINENDDLTNTSLRTFPIGLVSPGECQRGKPGMRLTLVGKAGSSGLEGGSMARTGARVGKLVAQAIAEMNQGWQRSCFHIS